jgi:hypothetical protein
MEAKMLDCRIYLKLNPKSSPPHMDSALAHPSHVNISSSLICRFVAYGQGTAKKAASDHHPMEHTFPAS